MITPAEDQTDPYSSECAVRPILRGDDLTGSPLALTPKQFVDPTASLRPPWLVTLPLPAYQRYSVVGWAAIAPSKDGHDEVTMAGSKQQNC